MRVTVYDSGKSCRPTVEVEVGNIMYYIELLTRNFEDGVVGKVRRFSFAIDITPYDRDRSDPLLFVEDLYLAQVSGVDYMVNPLDRCGDFRAK